MNKTCCDFGCNQGRDCPVRTFYIETEGVFPMTTGCSLKAPIEPARIPLPPIEPPSDTADRVIHLAQWLAVTVVFIATVAATAGFFTKG